MITFLKIKVNFEAVFKR